ncbi:MAG: hypothetical protein R3E77_16820 [Steroidobacteraceae bacterium]
MHARTATDEPQSASAAIAAVVVSVVAVAGFLLLPMLVAAATSSLRLTAGQIGVMSASLMLGSTLASALAVFWVRRFEWRIASLVLLAGLSASCALAAVSHQFTGFLLALAAAGLFGGSAYSLALTMLSDRRDPARWFGISVAAQVGFQVVGLWLGPAVIAAAGSPGLMGLFAALALAAIATVRYLPRRSETSAEVLSATSSSLLARGAVLLGCLLFFFNVGCYWTYVEVIGTSWGIAPQTLGTVLAIGVSAGILGAACAAKFGERHGLRAPLLIGAILTVVAALALRQPTGVWLFCAGVACYNFAWNYSLSYQYTAVNRIDPGGRSVAFAPAFHGAGGAIGAAVAAAGVDALGLQAVPWLTSVAAILSLGLFAVALRARTGSPVE